MRLVGAMIGSLVAIAIVGAYLPHATSLVKVAAVLGAVLVGGALGSLVVLAGKQ